MRPYILGKLAALEILAGANEEVKKKFNVHGIPVHIDRPKGTQKSWVYKDGRPTLHYTYGAHYGFLPGVKSTDDGDLDVWLGPNRKSEHVTLVEKEHSSELGKHDEFKAMLGFKDHEAAMDQWQHFMADRNKQVLNTHQMSISAFKELIKNDKLDSLRTAPLASKTQYFK